MKAFPLMYCLACLGGWGLIYLLSPNTCALAFQYVFQIASKKTLFMISSFLALPIVLLLEFRMVGPEKSSLRRILRPDASMVRDQLSCLGQVTGLSQIIGYLLTLGLPFFLGRYLIVLFPALKVLQFIDSFD